MEDLLVIIPCGQAKIWDKRPNAGPTLARYVYTGVPFVVNRAYAERFASRWVILSAKYGLISPDFVIPGPYNVTFKKLSTRPIDVSTLREQIRQGGLAGFSTIIGLGGADYREVIRQAFEGFPVRMEFPFAGVPLGKGLQAVKSATLRGTPLP